MGLLTSSLLLLGGVVVLWRTTHHAARLRIFAEASAGSILASAGLSTLLAYGADLPDIYRWGTSVATSPTSAVAFIVLGVALVQLAWRDSMKSNGQAPFWAPMPVVVVCLTLSVILWLGLRTREQDSFVQSTQARMEQFALQSKDLIEKQATQLERLTRAWADMPGTAVAAWDAEARKLLAQGAADLGCVSLAYVDRDLKTLWSYPAPASGQLAGPPSRWVSGFPVRAVPKAAS